MKCPICSNDLIDIGLGARQCPDRHGLLVDTKALKDAGSHVIRADAETPLKQPSSRQGRLSCPNCHNPMIVVDHAGSGIMIDMCSACPYRWLDAGELTHIARRKVGRLKPEQLMALEGLNSALTQTNNELADERKV